MNSRPVLVANLAGIVASCLFGASVVATRSAVEEIPPFALAFLRYGQGAIILLAILVFGHRETRPLGREGLQSCAVLGILMYALFPVLFNTSMQYTTASRGAVILATMPLWTALIARRFRAEQLVPAQVLGIIVSISGIAIVFAENGLHIAENRHVLIGNSIMVLVAISGGLYGVLAKPVLRQYGAIQVTATAMAIGASLLLLPALLDGLVSALTHASGSTFLLVLFLGTFGGAIAFWLITVALAELSPTQAMIYINLNPLVATLLGAVFLDESLTVWFVAGFVVVLAGLVMMNAPGLVRHREVRNRSG